MLTNAHKIIMITKLWNKVAYSSLICRLRKSSQYLGVIKFRIHTRGRIMNCSPMCSLGEFTAVKYSCLFIRWSADRVSKTNKARINLCTRENKRNDEKRCSWYESWMSIEYGGLCIPSYSPSACCTHPGHPGKTTCDTILENPTTQTRYTCRAYRKGLRKL